MSCPTLPHSKQHKASVYSGDPYVFFRDYYMLGDKWHELGDKVLRMSGKSSTFVVEFRDQRLSYFITNVVVSNSPLPAANTSVGLHREPYKDET